MLALIRFGSLDRSPRQLAPRTGAHVFRRAPDISIFANLERASRLPIRAGVRRLWVAVLLALVESTATATTLPPEQSAARLEQLATIFDVRSLIDRLAEAPAGSS